MRSSSRLRPSDPAVTLGDGVGHCDLLRVLIGHCESPYHRVHRETKQRLGIESPALSEDERAELLGTDRAYQRELRAQQHRERRRRQQDRKGMTAMARLRLRVVLWRARSFGVRGRTPRRPMSRTHRTRARSPGPDSAQPPRRGARRAWSTHSFCGHTVSSTLWERPLGAGGSPYPCSGGSRGWGSWHSRSGR